VSSVRGGEAQSFMLRDQAVGGSSGAGGLEEEHALHAGSYREQSAPGLECHSLVMVIFNRDGGDREFVKLA